MAQRLHILTAFAVFGLFNGASVLTQSFVQRFQMWALSYKYDVIDNETTDRASRATSDRLSLGWGLRADFVVSGIVSQRADSLVLLTIFARGCDPVLGFLKAGGQHSDAEIAELVMIPCFDGLKSRAGI